MKTLRFMPRMYEETRAILSKAGYERLAQAIDVSLQRARANTPISIAAKLMYESGTQRRKHPERYVRLPGRAGTRVAGSDPKGKQG